MSHTIPLSILIEKAHAHGGHYDARGVGRWPWGSPHVPESRRDDTCSCSTFSLAVCSSAFGREPTLAEHRRWMIAGPIGHPQGPLIAAVSMTIDARGKETGVRLCQGWAGVPLQSAGHTWIEVDTDEGVMVIDATPTKPWCGPRVMEPRPRTWRRRWRDLYCVSLDVDRHI